MKLTKFKLNIALLAPLIYESVMTVYPMDGLSFFKIIITGLLWVSFFVAFSQFVKNYSSIKKEIPKISFILLLLLLSWNIFCIVRSFYEDFGVVTTLFGNIYVALAFLVPFSFSFIFQKNNIKVIWTYLFRLLIIGSLLFLVFLVVSLIGDPVFQKLVIVLLEPVVFLITLFFFNPKKNRLLIVVSAVLLFYTAFYFGSRAMLLRIALLSSCLVLLWVYQIFKFKLLLIFSYLLLIIPFYLLQKSFETGESAIEQILTTAEGSDTDLDTDTRTFLYTEVYSDLVLNGQLVFGKGVNGGYYSEYFSSAEGDSENRLTVEVGLLALLLKGGLVAVILYLSIFISAIYLSFFRSRNYFVIGCGYIVYVHSLLLFIENLISYSSYNFIIWLFVGICLSKKIRYSSNRQIISMLYPKRIKNVYSVTTG